MEIIVCENYEEMSKKAANICAALIKIKPNTILGLPTGSTPLGMYDELAKMNTRGEINFSDVITFNLDEYYPIKRSNDQSYYYFMNKNLFSKINIKPENTNIPDGETDNPEEECLNYEEKIQASGGIDIQVLGIGRNGHIGFNEPDINLKTYTHITDLTENTLQANARFFKDISEVPTSAITMGIATILKSKKIILLASGKEKHKALVELMNSDINTGNPATMLKLHPDVTLLCDKEAYSDTSLGIDIGGIEIKFGILKDNQIIAKKQISTPACDSAVELVDYIADTAAKLVEKYAVTKIGVGVPGTIRYKKVTSVNLPFKETPLAELLSKKLNVPIKLENDANCAALGESRLGAGKDFRNQIMLTIGTGIGGGIIIKNKIYHGKGDAGEIGHIIVQKDGVLCNCGQSGCIEKYASTSALCSNALKVALENTSSILYNLYTENNSVMNGEVVFAAIHQGCPVAREVFDEFISYLAIGITNLIRIFSPDLIVISGGITAEGDTLINPLVDKVRLNVPIRISSLQSDAGIVGAALL